MLHRELLAAPQETARATRSARASAHCGRAAVVCNSLTRQPGSSSGEPLFSRSTRGSTNAVAAAGVAQLEPAVQTTPGRDYRNRTLTATEQFARVAAGRDGLNGSSSGSTHLRSSAATVLETTESHHSRTLQTPWKVQPAASHTSAENLHNLQHVVPSLDRHLASARNGLKFLEQEPQHYQQEPDAPASTSSSAAAPQRTNLRSLQFVKFYEGLTEHWLGKRAKVWKTKGSRVQPGPALSTLSVDGLLGEYSRFIEGGELGAALAVVMHMSSSCPEPELCRLAQKPFLQAAAQRQAVTEAFRFVEALCDAAVSKHTISLLLDVCAEAGDWRSGLRAAELAEKRNIVLDERHYTTLIKACAKAGNVERAIRLYQEVKIKRPSGPLDADVFSSVISSFAKAIELEVPHNRKQQLVLVERAFGVLEEGLARGAGLPPPVWNALLDCTVMACQVERAFQVVDMMQLNGCSPTVETYGGLIDVCVRTGQPQLAFKLFKKALREGMTDSVQLYTEALKACLLLHRTEALRRGQQVANIMRRAGTKPDQIFYSHLITIAGKSRRLDTAYGFLKQALDEGIRPGTAIGSALMAANIINSNHFAARKVYELMRQQGIYPDVDQYNRLMFEYSKEWRLGEVVGLLSAMVNEAKLAPNRWTFAVLLHACEKTDQAALAFEVVTAMKASGIAVDEVHLWCLVKLCFNRVRYQWYPPSQPLGKPLKGAALPKDSPHHSQGVYEPQTRYVEATRLLEVLRHPRAAQRASQLGEMENVNWAARALAVYQDAVASGVKPQTQVLDRLLACLRMQFKGVPFVEQPGGPEGTDLDDLELVLPRNGSSHGQAEEPQHEVGVMDMPPTRLHHRLPPSFMSNGHGLLSSAGMLGHATGTGLLGQVNGHLVPNSGAMLGHMNGHHSVLSHANGSGHSMLAHGVTHMLDDADVGFGGVSGMGVPPSRLHPRTPVELDAAAVDGDVEGVARTARPKFEVPFERRAIMLIEEAMTMGMLPQLDLDANLTLDLRFMRPTLAEVFLLYVLKTLERRTTSTGKPHPHIIRVLVPAFDANMVMWPSYVEKLNKYYPDGEGICSRDSMDEEELAMAEEMRAGSRGGAQWEQEEVEAEGDVLAAAASASQPSVAPVDGLLTLFGLGTHGRQEGAEELRPETGLAVAATLRRMNLHCKVDSNNGVVLIDQRDFNAWVAQKQKYSRQQAERERLAAQHVHVPPLSQVGQEPNALGHHQPSHQEPLLMGRALSEQQRGIRMGLGPQFVRRVPSTLR